MLLGFFTYLFSLGVNPNIYITILDSPLLTQGDQNKEAGGFTYLECFGKFLSLPRVDDILKTL